ncbi:MAG: hypothetical protein ABIQ82_14685 [Variovorax sp.]
MLISILIPAYARPEQLAEALASVAVQDRTLIGEILIGDDSPREYWDRNRAVIAASGLADLIEYLPSEPSKGTYPNQWFLGARASCDHLLFLHNDDQLCPNGLRLLASACAGETDSRVKLWFGGNLIMDETGQVDAKRTTENDLKFGKDGPARAQPMWQWCVTESVPPNSFLIARDTYVRYMKGPRDGNVGDWALSVRLANSGAWGRFVKAYVSAYRVQAGSVTTAGRGMDVHRFYELAEQLVVPADAVAQKRQRFSGMAPVAVLRYARDGERLHAWRCFLSPNWTWRQRFSARGLATIGVLLTPRICWAWALRFR